MPLEGKKYERVMLQNGTEWFKFTKLARSENVKSYLELGCKFGGTLWKMVNELPKGSKVVAVDLPHADRSFKNTLPHLQECVQALQKRGYDVHLIIGDTTDPKVVEQVRSFAPFDLCFVDANHTYAFVKKDWENYGPMCRMIAFHDINFYREGGQAPDKLPIDAPQFWAEIKDGYRNVEFKYDKRDNGIGVIWR